MQLLCMLPLTRQKYSRDHCAQAAIGCRVSVWYVGAFEVKAENHWTRVRSGGLKLQCVAIVTFPVFLLLLLLLLQYSVISVDDIDKYILL